MDRVMIFIDGSNLYKALQAKYGKAKIDLGKFSEKLCGERKLFRTNYYNSTVPEEMDPDAARAQQRFFSAIERLPYTKLLKGRLERRDDTWIEKGVDIMIATDMLRHAANDNFYEIRRSRERADGTICPTGWRMSARAGRILNRRSGSSFTGTDRDGLMKRNETSLRLVDAYSGAGGMTLGFTRLGGDKFIPVWANDINGFAACTYDVNFGNHCIIGDIEVLLKNPGLEIPKADLVIGGPPCQGFSLLNKKRDGDPRKRLWRPFLEIVVRSDASAFVMENVPQLLGSAEYAQFEEEAAALGFSIASAVLCAADYGVPQKRFRAFVVGCRFADPASTFPPKRTHYDPDKPPGSNGASPSDYVDSPEPWRTVRDAISDLPPPEGTEIRDEDPPLDLHFGRRPTEISLRRYRAIPEEGMNRFDLQERAPELTPACWIRKKSGGTDLFGRLWWDRPAFTIRTEFFKPEKGRYLHPEQHRPITHREAARLQSFPDDFVFFGSKIEIAKQIGNAVPPLLAAAVGRSVLELFSLKETENCPTALRRKSAAS